FDEASVTATENAVMAAALARGTVILRNVAMEPHVQGLCRMLCAMGARIDGIGTPTLTVEGVARLGACSHAIGPDYLEIGSFIGLAGVTGGRLTVGGVRADDMRMIRVVFDKLGLKTSLDGDQLVVPPDQDLWVRPDFHGHIPTIYDAPWPAFPTDLMSVVIAVATQCTGTVLFFEKMFEGRMFFVDHLIGMGARIIMCDPHRVVVVGPTPLYGTRMESPDIRAGMAMLVATCAARGRSIIGNVRQIDRGYEGVDQKLRQLGARIERMPVKD
ncbi:MAG: UDP-N-acetylglucosamine 1-carboxyvinyltransferase, partial [Deltaproteobacteria bacterium]|nr:UDP-N-acetylglucosamine 1-carboxyvinyltransferase [Deltaproteobacteria bacterium]